MLVPNPGAGVDDNVGVEAVPNGVVNWDDPPKRLPDGAGVVEVAKRLDEDGAEAGVVRVEKALEEVAAEGKEDCCGWLVAGAAICAMGCAGAGKCSVGWTLLAAASCLAASRLFASRNGSLPLPMRRCSLRYSVFIDSTY